jgi:hypothetical protein
MLPVETAPGIWGRGMKESRGGDEGEQRRG